LHKLNRIYHRLTMDEIGSIFVVVVRSLHRLLVHRVVGITGEVWLLGFPFSCWATTALIGDFLIVGTRSTNWTMFRLRWISNQLLKWLIQSYLALISLVCDSLNQLRTSLFLLWVLSLRDWTIWVFRLCLAIKAVSNKVSWISWVRG
jgi:hypothetical protein